MWQALSDGLSILSEKWTIVLGVLIVTCLGCCLSFFLSPDLLKDKKKFRRSAFVLSGFFSVSVILRLAFLTEAFAPPYFDSVEHYRIIKNLVMALDASTLLETLPTLTSTYYHLGFHFLASLLTFGLRANPIDVILVLGQVILAAIPIPIYFVIRHETQSDAAALFGMLLAGFGWYMPGFAVNWGKYPALAGLLALEVVLSIAYFIARKKTDRIQPALVGWLILGILLSTFIHTRTLVIITISIVSWLIAGKMRILSKSFQYSLLGVSLAGILVFGILVKQELLLNLALEPYLSDGIWITLSLVILSPFALDKFPRGVYFSLLFIICVLAALFIQSVAWFPGLENQTILDRPFVEMVLYLPLSILAGLGLAGILQTVNSIHALTEKKRLYTRVLITILLVGFASVMSIGRYDFYSSDCCLFVGYDDTVALDWIDRNLPPDARILIAATQLSVLPAGPSESLVGTDAGLWIPALTGRNTILAPFDIDFHSKSTLEQLCQNRVGYVYIGRTDQKFNAAQLNEKAEWYDMILFLPNAQLYQLTGCSKQVTMEARLLWN
jgi:hypothetical protein